ncbi:MAG: hypothetical protein J5586_00970 [Clostridia bacterium]|nr:hypothetical protein [Clostridia bacterium]
MNNEDIFRAVGEADDAVLDEEKVKRNNSFRRIAGMAAALLAVGAAVLIAVNPWNKEKQTSTDWRPVMSNETGATPEPFVVKAPMPEPDATPNPEWFAEADYKPFKNAQELADKADIIVRAQIYGEGSVMAQTRFEFDENGDPIPDESSMEPRTLYEFSIVEVFKGGNEALKLDRFMTQGCSFLFSDYYLCCPPAPDIDCGEYILFLYKPEIGSQWLWDNCAMMVGFLGDEVKVSYSAMGNPVIESRFEELTYAWLEGMRDR